MSEPYEYETQYGVLRVFVAAAVIRDHLEPGFGRVEEECPALLVTSDPDRNRKPYGWLRYRGREYTITEHYMLDGSAEWRYDHRGYNTGVQRRGVDGDDVVRVAFDSGPARTLGQVAKDVRDRFAAEHPEWVYESRIMRRTADLEKARSESVKANRAVVDADKRAAELEQEIRALRVQRGS